MTVEPAGEVILYQRDDGAPVLEVRLDAETVWLSRQQIAELFQTSRTNTVEHIQHVYEEGDLEETATCRKFRQVRTEGSRQVTREIPYYNLDLIISVGYWVKSTLATQFRIWATARLREAGVIGAISQGFGGQDLSLLLDRPPLRPRAQGRCRMSHIDELSAELAPDDVPQLALA